MRCGAQGAGPRCAAHMYISGYQQHASRSNTTKAGTGVPSAGQRAASIVSRSAAPGRLGVLGGRLRVRAYPRALPRFGVGLRAPPLAGARQPTALQDRLLLREPAAPRKVPRATQFMLPRRPVSVVLLAARAVRLASGPSVSRVKLGKAFFLATSPTLIVSFCGMMKVVVE